MSENRDLARPVITSIDPTTVNQNSNVTLAVFGQNFNEDSRVMVSAYFPVTTFLSAGHLEAALTTQETGTAGTKEIKVHDLGNGGLSNAVPLTVRPVTK